MCLINFKDGVIIDLHEDCTVDVIRMSRTDIEFNNHVFAHDEIKIFNAINNRLNGVLSH